MEYCQILFFNLQFLILRVEPLNLHTLSKSLKY